MTPDEFNDFKAVMTVVESVQKTRNKLAHWGWGVCKERPDLLILANPKMLKERDHRVAAHFQAKQPGDTDDAGDWLKTYSRRFRVM